MDLVTSVDSALSWTGKIMQSATPDHYSDSTPCTEWDLRTLANHMVGGAWMFAGALNGDALPTGAPGDLVGDDASAAYDAASAALRAAAASDGVMERPTELPLGTMPGSVTLSLALMDTLTHGWDMAVATGQPAELPPELASQSMGFAEQAISDGMRGPGAPFGARVDAPADASPGEMLLAFLGRNPRA
jgi:uncharacterized protein (TIGR03086 family)